MGRRIRPVGVATLERRAAVAGSSTGLHELPDLRHEQDVSTRIYTGILYTRYFNCPKGNFAAVKTGDLLLGRVMPAAWGGVATTNPEDPRLQRVRRVQQTGGAMDRLIGEFLKINIR